MRFNNDPKNVLTVLVLLATATISLSSNAALVNYSQNFETLNQADPDALGNDGWFISPSVPAPNNGPGFSTIISGEGGTAQGTQQLKVFSNYMDAGHTAGSLVETLVYQEQTISATDVGATWNFTFDVKQCDQMPDSSSNAFLKTTSSESIFDTTAFGTDWGTETLSLVIDNSLVGQLLQFGFSTTATSYRPSGMLYDNINFSTTSAVPLPGAAWLFISGFGALLGWTRIVRRKITG
jgi:hypothetical protein